eukprot:Gb_39787 [translate_table: standard]
MSDVGAPATDESTLSMKYCLRLLHCDSTHLTIGGLKRIIPPNGGNSKGSSHNGTVDDVPKHRQTGRAQHPRVITSCRSDSCNNLLLHSLIKVTVIMGTVDGRSSGPELDTALLYLDFDGFLIRKNRLAVLHVIMRGFIRPQGDPSEWLSR